MEYCLTEMWKQQMTTRRMLKSLPGQSLKKNPKILEILFTSDGTTVLPGLFYSIRTKLKDDLLSSF